MREHVRRALAQWNAAHPGSSERIARVLLLPDAPSIDANEITDKGYINQRLALERRAADVARLYAARNRTPDDVIGSLAVIRARATRACRSVARSACISTSSASQGFGM